ncbi:TRM9B methyltransferase, partial [Polyodon spathula]|nr:TRM9B methyltransferase [Polyodon spathula]
MENEAIQLEKQHVHSVYEKTAPYLSDLRCKAWPRVRQFLLDQEPGSLIADIGCGTGKYLSVNSQIYNLGCDYCSPLVEKARKQGHEVLVCDNLQLPFRDQVFNAVISIGVIHHFSTKERRIRAIREIARTTTPGGMVMIYAWALEQKRRRFEKQDVFVPWNKALCSRNPSDSDALRKEISTKRSYSLGSYISVGRCCIKNPEEQDNRFYSGLGKSLHSWFFSKSLDESSLKKHFEKMKPLRSSEGWVDNAVLEQPSKHCSIDLGRGGSLLNGQSFEEDDVFVETTNYEEAQWWKATGTLREMNTGHQRVVNRKNGPVNGEQYKPTVNGTNELNSMSNRIFQRTSTLDSTDSILDAIDVEDEQDNLVDTKDFMRYYHVFKEGELSHLIEESVNELSIVSSCFDHGNWCVIAKRKMPGVSAL